MAKVCYGREVLTRRWIALIWLNIPGMLLVITTVNCTCFSIGAQCVPANSLCNKTNTVTLFLGEPLLIYLESCTKAVSSTQAQYPTIGYDDDPGMPNSASLSKFAHRNVTFKNSLGLEYDGPEMYTAANFTWTLGCGLDPGRKHYDIYFYARNSDGIATYSLHIDVVFPKPIFLAPGPTFITTRVGCSEKIVMIAEDSQQSVWALGVNKFYTNKITIRKYRAFPNGNISTVSDLNGSSYSVMDFREQNGSLAIFDWTPIRGQEAQNFVICFDLVDFCGYSQVQSMCYNFSVLKCQVCIRNGETLQSIAADYNTDFLSLYTANVALRRPHRIPVGTVINSGIFYKIQHGDTLSSISGSFFTNREMIFAMNPDVANAFSQGRSLVPADRICISLPVCGSQCNYGPACTSHRI